MSTTAIVGMPSFLASFDRDVFLLGVDHEDRARELLHVLDAAERLLELVELAVVAGLFFLRDVRSTQGSSSALRSSSDGRWRL